jgi:AhpD family alkylhydroperoxidase
MARIRPIQASKADTRTAQLLQSVEKKMGTVPNLVATMANSPAVAQAYLSFAQALAGGSLPGRLREQIALTVGQANECDYCIAAHSYLGEEEVLDARRGTANDDKAAVALSFARRIVDNRGLVSDDHLEEVRRAGYTNGEIAEIVANVALNIFTNYFNHVAGTEIDFPAVSLVKVA